jgi:hypothetical protein
LNLLYNYLWFHATDTVGWPSLIHRRSRPYRLTRDGPARRRHIDTLIQLEGTRFSLNSNNSVAKLYEIPLLNLKSRSRTS